MTYGLDEKRWEIVENIFCWFLSLKIGFELAPSEILSFMENNVLISSIEKPRWTEWEAYK